MINHMLGVVIVNYLSDSLTAQFVREEVSKISLPHVTVIVNNGATEASSKALEAETGVKVLTCPNDGFAIGNNVGIKYLTENYLIDYFLFTNNDIHLETPGVVESLVKKMEDNPEIGIIGPQIIGPDGRRQSPEPYISLWDKYIFVYLSTPFMSKTGKSKRFFLDYAAEAGEGFHYKLMGSFFMCRQKDIQAIGGFDPGTFLYAEETILTERMAVIGKKSYFDPSVTVIHQHGATISAHMDRYAMSVQRFRSDAYYYRKYKGYSFFSIKLAELIYKTIIWIQRLWK